MTEEGIAYVFPAPAHNYRCYENIFLFVNRNQYDLYLRDLLSLISGRKRPDEELAAIVHSPVSK